MAAMLLDRGAALEATGTRDGRTALMMAAKNGKQEVVALLLARGADASARDNEGDTAESQASTEEIKALLRVRQQRWS
jgi:uncharacterized protein